jgi:hypothetical protein
VADHSFKVLLPHSAHLGEWLHLRVRLMQHSRLSPKSLVQKVRVGTRLTLPVRILGAKPPAVPSGIEIAPWVTHGVDTPELGDLPNLSVGQLLDLDAGSGISVEAVGFAKPGVYESFVLIRPEGANYRLRLPVLFRVWGRM